MCKSGKVGPFPALVMPFISVLQILGKVKIGDLLTSLVTTLVQNTYHCKGCPRTNIFEWSYVTMG